MDMNLYKKGFLLVASLILSACYVQSQPTSIDENYKIAEKNLKSLSQEQPPVKKIDFYEALARGLKYNLDYRIKLANNALQLDQLQLAEFAMFPQLNATGSLYTRSNDLSSFGTTTTGQTTDVLNSTPRTLRSARGAFSWNILDFGVSYVRAKQQSERYLIALEEERKQAQKLTQDITTAYWNAYSAQILMGQTR
ncbi:MAG: transporter, partial [Gammaproteobacteria bacterium]